jgi:hypothetical protein
VPDLELSDSASATTLTLLRRLLSGERRTDATEGHRICGQQVHVTRRRGRFHAGARRLYQRLSSRCARSIDVTMPGDGSD